MIPTGSKSARLPLREAPIHPPPGSPAEEAALPGGRRGTPAGRGCRSSAGRRVSPSGQRGAPPAGTAMVPAAQTAGAARGPPGAKEDLLSLLP